MLCPRGCGVHREPSKGNGFCHTGSHPVVARVTLHFWEEPCISGTRGSDTVLFIGCTLDYVFCQNYDISTRQQVGEGLTVAQLAEVFQSPVEQGAHNIGLVSPMQFAPPIAEALRLKKLSVSVVYNSSGYETVEMLKLLEGLVDVYLPDLKYVSSEPAARYSGVTDYPEYAKQAILEMVCQTGAAQFDEQGMLVRGIVAHHLTLPGYTHESIAVLDRLREHLLEGVPVSLMAQYIPCGKAERYPGINRPITAREPHKVEEYLMEPGSDGFVQRRSSAKKTYIFSSDLEGLEFLSDSKQ